MTRFHIEMTLVCPSRWTEERVREYVEQHASCQEERDSITVTPVITPDAEALGK